MYFLVLLKGPKINVAPVEISTLNSRSWFLNTLLLVSEKY